MEIKATYVALSVSVLAFLLIIGIYTGFKQGFNEAGTYMPPLAMNEQAFNKTQDLISISSTLNKNTGANWTQQPNTWDYINLLFMGGWSAVKMVTTSLFGVLPSMLNEVANVLRIPGYVVSLVTAMFIFSLLIALIIIILNREIK